MLGAGVTVLGHVGTVEVSKEGAGQEQQVIKLKSEEYLDRI